MSLASNIAAPYNVCSHIVYIMYEHGTLVHGFAILNYINLEERRNKKKKKKQTNKLETLSYLHP